MGILNNELNELTNQYLEEVEDDIEIELGEYRTEGWTIDNKEMAMKVDYLLHKLEEDIANDESIAEAQKAPLQAKIDKLEEGKSKVDEWLERSTKGAKATIESLKNQLHLFHIRTIQAEEEENKKRIAEGKKPLKISKSIKLTHRDLTSKQKQPEIVKDDSEVIAWLEDNYAGSITTVALEYMIKEKRDNGSEFIHYTELNELIEPILPDYMKLEKKLTWAEYKKTLTKKEEDIYAKDGVGNEIKVGTKLVYVDVYGAVVPVELIDQGVEFNWKLNS